jgi:hypothetical protein
MEDQCRDEDVGEEGEVAAAVVAVAEALVVAVAAEARAAVQVA